MDENGGCACEKGNDESLAATAAETTASPTSTPDPILLPVARAPGTAQPISRFDLFEEMRRRGMPAAYPQGYDPRQRPPAPGGADPRLLPDHLAPGLPPILDPLFTAPVAPDFAEPSVLQKTPHIAGRPVAAPGTRAKQPTNRPRASARSRGILSPDGSSVACSSATPPMMPDGTSAQCSMWGRSWQRAAMANATTAQAVMPPEYLCDVGGAAESRSLGNNAWDEKEKLRKREMQRRASARSATPIELSPGITDLSDQESDVEAPGQQPCTKDAGYAQMTQFAAGTSVTPPGTEQYRGKGGKEVWKPAAGPGAKPKEPAAPKPAADDPCPCKCVCFPLLPCIFTFDSSSGNTQSVPGLFGKDTTFFGQGVTFRVPRILSPNDGLTSLVQSQMQEAAPVRYGATPGLAPAAQAPLDGVSWLAQSRIGKTKEVQPSTLLYPPLSEGTEDETLTRRYSPAPVGPGPGIVELGRTQLRPAGGKMLLAPPGTLPAWLATGARATGPGWPGGSTSRALVAPSGGGK